MERDLDAGDDLDLRGRTASCANQLAPCAPRHRRCRAARPADGGPSARACVPRARPRAPPSTAQSASRMRARSRQAAVAWIGPAEAALVAAAAGGRSDRCARDSGSTASMRAASNGNGQPIALVRVRRRPGSGRSRAAACGRRRDRMWHEPVTSPAAPKNSRCTAPPQAMRCPDPAACAATARPGRLPIAQQPARRPAPPARRSDGPPGPAVRRCTRRSESAARCGRGDSIASTASATATMRASSRISSPFSPRG